MILIALCAFQIWKARLILFSAAHGSHGYGVPSPSNSTLPDMHTNFTEWFRWLRSNLDTDRFTWACVVCWRIWWVRNQVVHNSDDSLDLTIVEWATNFLEAFQETRLPKILNHTPSRSEWSPPPPTHVQINFDVGFFEDGKYQIAVVARGSDGECLWWRAVRFTWHPPVEVGEARAALEAIRLALSKG